MKKENAETILGYTQQTSVEPKAIQIAQRLIATGVGCKINKEFLPRAGETISLFRFRQAFPLLGYCVIQWALQKKLSSIRQADVLQAMASDFHYSATKANIALYIPKYRLTPKNINKFYLYDLVVGGQPMGKELFYPTKNNPMIIFCLKKPVEEKNQKHFAVVHLGQIVNLSENNQLARLLHQTHQSQPKIWPLFQKAKGKKVEVFYPAASEQHK